MFSSVVEISYKVMSSSEHVIVNYEDKLPFQNEIHSLSTQFIPVVTYDCVLYTAISSKVPFSSILLLRKVLMKL